jgi:Mg2+ and Co2+ transporter CorA
MESRSNLLLFDMTFGGVLGTTKEIGFMEVIVLMVLIVLVETWYFTCKGWLD